MAYLTQLDIWRFFLLLVWLALLFTSTAGIDEVDEKLHEDDEIQRIDTKLVNVTKMEAFLYFWESQEVKVRVRGGQILTDIGAISEWIGCGESSSWYADSEAYSRIPTEEDYSILFEAYRYAMSKRPKAERTSRPAPVQQYTPNAFSVGVEVRSIPEIGRGIFATQDILKGTLISRPINALEFYTEESFRDFVVYAVSRGSKIICDVFLWMYAVKISPRGYCVCTDADHTSLYNSGDYDLEEWEEEEEEEEYECDAADGSCKWEDEAQTRINVGELKTEEISYGCQEPPVYALRDIQEGEELLMSYSDFSEPEGWSELGIWD